MKDTDNWQPYKGVHPRAFVDIVLKDGTMHKSTWPRLGRFTTVTGQVIKGTQVAQIKRSESQAISRVPVRRYSRGRGVAR